MKSVLSLAGWYGVLAILLAYAMLSFGVLTSHSLSYQLLNLTGAAGLIAEAYSKRDYQPTVLNVIWFVIALVSLGQIIL